MKELGNKSEKSRRGGLKLFAVGSVGFFRFLIA